MALLGMLCAATASTAAKLPIPRAVDAKPLDQGTPTKPIQLSKMMVKLSRGEQFGRIKVGLLCVPGGVAHLEGRPHAAGHGRL
ncbi:MAG TPA: hypothetical protein VF509_03650 [Sphingobium sp.]